MFDQSLINPLLIGDELYESLKSIPKYDELICHKDKSARLVALSDIYSIYLPSKMSEEIYSKLYLSLIRSMNKKCSINAIKQSNENYKAIRQISFQGILGGADSYTIIGCSGIGKTSAISRAVKLISDEPYFECCDSKIIPVLSVQCPFDSSVKGLSLEILRKIDAVLQTKYYSNAIRSHATVDVLIGIISQVALNHIGVIIIDEIQNCAVSKNGKVFIHSLTQLINDSGVSICLVGTPECTSFFQQKMQLARRSLGLYYQPLEYNDYFAELCETVFRYQYTQHKNVLTDGIIEWLYEHSGGLVSMIISLLHDSQELAILSGKEKIDIETLNEAFEKRNTMLHSFIKPGIKVLPKTGTITKKNRQPISENKDATIEKLDSNVDPYTEKNNTFVIEGLSIIEVVEQCKLNSFNVVEVLKQYFVVEEIGEEGCKLC